jgi:HK97 family phage major capsid protein
MTKLEQLKAKMEGIRNQISDLRNKGELTDEDRATVQNLATDFKNVQGEYETEKTMVEIENSIATPQAQVAKKEVNTSTISVSGTKAEEKRHGFENRGEFYTAVKNASKAPNRADERLTQFSNIAQESVGADGGYLVPVDFREEIQEKVESDESLLNLTDQYKTSKNKLSLPISETAAWGANGIQAYWEGEAKKYKESKEEFKEIDLKLKKLTAYVKVTDELLDDSSALESFIRKKAPDAMIAKINDAIIGGNGVGMPQGILESGFKYAVGAEGGQPSDEIFYENISKMWGHMLPMSKSKAVWLYNAALEEKLRLMKFDSSAPSPVPAYMPPGGLNQSPYANLMGRPAMPMMGALKALGTEGDLCLVDLSYYITVMKTAGIEQFISTHVHFDQDLTAFKFRTRMDGQCPFSSPVTSQYGDHKASGIVTLQDR